MKPSYAAWMANLSTILAEHRLNHIAMPGSHDTGAYLIDWSIDPSLVGTIYEKVYKLSRFQCVRNIVDDWTKTQKLTVRDQLMLGIRCLDLRVMHVNGTFYLAHTYICGRLEDVLNDIMTFLEDYPQEVLFLRFSRDYENRATMTRKRNDQVIDKLHEVLGSYLIPRTADNKFPTLGDVLSGTGRIVLYYKGRYTQRAYVWNRHYIHGGWTTTTKVNQKLEFLANELTRMKRTARNLNELGFTLTPGPSDIVKNVMKRMSVPCIAHNGLQHLAQEMHAALPEFIKEHQAEMSKISVITTDFPTVDFVENVISLNLQ